MTRASLQQLYADHTGKASHKWSSYLHEYDRLFSALRDKPVSMLEIGIQNGGSLNIWAKYFENALTIVGADINIKCGELSYDDPRIHLVIGDINSSKSIQEVLNHSFKFDIVIDDGSHQSEDIIKSFINYFPYLTDGGFFVAEDLHCSYWDKFSGGLFDPYSSITFFKRLIDIVNFEHWGIEKSRQDLLAGIIDHYKISLDARILEEIHSVEFINSMCVIRKSVKGNGLGRHVVVGNYEHVVGGNLLLHGLPYELDPLFIQKDNYWSTLEAPPEELVLPMQKRLFKLQAELHNTEEKVISLESEISGLKNSRSWKLTAPFRSLSDMFKSLKKAIKSGRHLSTSLKETGSKDYDK